MITFTLTVLCVIFWINIIAAVCGRIFLATVEHIVTPQAPTAPKPPGYKPTNEEIMLAEAGF